MSKRNAEHKIYGSESLGLHPNVGDEDPSASSLDVTISIASIQTDIKNKNPDH